ncbi:MULTISPECIES: hypothetical protein [Acinetobacter]|uniref:Uncharacterized protein n=1 Tax=Acinetobacter beijerinckii CIP 110307 TaxID=1217648 RepID=N9EEA0_9GAMM|nr:MULTISPECIES: hypothetical protein [Acinetobacter]ENW08763.1 hypothetical protein F933_00090 [Acinetobacter beijerinckii CIP 110307]UTO18704.1 hypothetical protein NGC85_12260 [Acinetobacter sp. Z1]
MKKTLGLLLAMTASTSIFAHENPDRKGKCIEVNGKNIPTKCVISSGGGAGGMYKALKIGDKEYLIEENTMNPDAEERSISLGRNADTLQDAKEYYREAKTKQVIKTYKDGAWFCTKQIKGKLDVCYSY